MSDNETKIDNSPTVPKQFCLTRSQTLLKALPEEQTGL
jgi:hypothetical protein